MFTPELHISNDFIALDRIDNKTLWTHFADLKKTKALIFALCIQGHAKVMINLVQYNIGPNTMIAIPSESFIQILKSSDDMLLHAVLFSLPLIQQTHLDHSIVNKFYTINEHPLLPMPEKIFSIYTEAFALLTRIHTEVPFLFSRATSKSMLEALLQGFTELSERKALLQIAPIDKPSIIFHQFIRLVQEHHAQEHQVQFYATKLEMKSTTLCHIVKKKSEQTAMGIINSILILEAKTLLRTTNIPVKDIAISLGFNNAAFFSKFFKKHINITPQKFRHIKE